MGFVIHLLDEFPLLVLVYTDWSRSFASSSLQLPNHLGQYLDIFHYMGAGNIFERYLDISGLSNFNIGILLLP